MSRKSVVCKGRYRIMSWNIGGCLSTMHLSSDILSMFEHADILTFSHSGYVLSDIIPDFPGFKCIMCSPRPYEAQWGGVAVFARDHIHVTAALDLPSFGMSWFQIHGVKDIYCGACYFPHGASSYLRHEGGNLNASSHYEKLSEVICQFSVLGEVVFMGDLNARTACLSDYSDESEMYEWQAMCEANLPVPPDFLAYSDQVRLLRPRASMDHAHNPNGNLLLDSCKRLGMVILNGRLPSDMQGSHTYYQHGKVDSKCRSVIDYFVSSPGLVFSKSGEIKGSSDLQVGNIDSIPFRPGGGRFDHAPISLEFEVECNEPAARKKKIGKKKCGQQQAVRYKWSDNHREIYVQHLISSPSVNVFFAEMYNSHSSDGVASAFNGAIKAAMGHLHDDVGNVISKGGRKEAHDNRPSNTWYDDRCRAARQSYVDADGRWGAGSELAKEAFKKYRSTTRAARREWERQRAEQLHGDLRFQPKRFWKAYGKSSKLSSAFGLEQWSEYFKKLFEASPNKETGDATDEAVWALNFPLPSEHDLLNAAALNTDFTECEIVSALDKVANGKAAGVDGIPMEFLKHAVIVTPGEGGANTRQYILRHHITFLFNKVLAEGYPVEWATGALVPVPKPKGNPESQDDYRGIAVGSAISKLFSIVLLQRLDKWAEDNNLRAAGQAGFRAERGTPDNAFVLNHVLEKYRSLKKPVYAAFIDFRKAYDCIDRDVLWQSLQSLGLHGRMLDNLKAIYKDVNVRVRMGSDLGEAFPSFLGVKQGDPLSPLLFGLLIDRFEKFVALKLPDVGVRLRDIILKVLLYADDLVLLAESPSDLQLLLDALLCFSKLNGLTVNIKKSEVVVLNKKYCRHENIHLVYDNLVLEVKSFFIYLGMMFDEYDGMKKAGRRGMNKGRAALFAMMRRTYELEMNNVYIRCHLFDSLVKPILSYGCEVWGPYMFAKGDSLTLSGLSTELEFLHKGFLRQCLGVRKSVPDLALMSELQRKPLIFGMLKQTLRFWNKMHSRPDGDLVKLAMVENCEMAVRGCVDCWSSYLTSSLRAYGINILDDASQQLDVVGIIESAHAQWMADMSRDSSVTDVRDISEQDRKGFKKTTYVSWFQDLNRDKHETFWYCLNRRDLISAIARFRMGSHNLNIETDRWNGVSRNLRLCKLCDLNCREDEFHLVSECPFYDEIRLQYNLPFDDLSIGQSAFKIFMNGQWRKKSSEFSAPHFWNVLAGFLNKCMLKRNEQHKTFCNI